MNRASRSPWPLVWGFGLALLAAGAGCTFIAWNSSPVTVSDRDSHDAGTNGRTLDVNISPR